MYRSFLWAFINVHSDKEKAFLDDLLKSMNFLALDVFPALLLLIVPNRIKLEEERSEVLR